MQFPCKYDPMPNSNGWPTVYGSPLGDAQMTLGFSVIDPLHSSPHTGIDLVAQEGVPIHDLLDFVVLAKGSAQPYSATDTTWMSGNWIRCKYADGTDSFYCHMSQPSSLVVGQAYPAGTQVGGVGHTGYTSRNIEQGGQDTGDHLHWTYNVNNMVVDVRNYFSGSTKVAGQFMTAVQWGVTGQAFVVFSGGSSADLNAAAKKAGATGLWLQRADGAYVLDVIDGPDFVDAEFIKAFANGVPMCAVTLVK